jgi:ABC-type phosphate/phosphonate transport system substrate-binding protein
MLTRAAQRTPATKPNLRNFISDSSKWVVSVLCLSLLALLKASAGLSASDEADSATPEFQRIEALPSQDVTALNRTAAALIKIANVIT